MKLIIDIPEEIFNKLPEAELGSNVIEDVLEAVENGIPLDDLRTEIEQKLKEPMYQHEGEDWMVGLIMAQDIIDKYNTESEPQESEDK